MAFIDTVANPLAIPCYLFLLVVPFRLHTLCNAGVPGRYRAQWNLGEMAKKLIILGLILLSVQTLMDPAAESERFLTMLQAVSYGFALAISLMQETRQIADVWYAQPLLWGLSLVVGMLSPFWTHVNEEGVRQNPGSRVEFYPMLLLLSLSSLASVQLYNQRAEAVKRSWISSQGGGPGIEFQLDEERGLPFIRRPGPDGNEGDGGDASPRGFQNPNIQFSVQFKNKIKHNNYEFIVTIEPENESNAFSQRGSQVASLVSPLAKHENGFFKQYKVKRTLFEFQELFNHLEGKNPHDELLRQFDYNSMFNPGVAEGQNLPLLEDFVNSLVRSSPPSWPGGSRRSSQYLLDKHV